MCEFKKTKRKAAKGRLGKLCAPGMARKDGERERGREEESKKARPREQESERTRDEEHGGRGGETK